MLQEIGTVKETENNIAYVLIKRKEACSHCEAKSFCMNFLGEKNEIIIKAINPLNAKKGDRVVLSLKSSKLLKASFLIYLVPVFFALIGAIIGFFFFKNEIIAAILSILFLSSVLLTIKIKNIKENEYIPIITEIKFN